MEINIICINDELRQIVHNKKYYDNDTVLYALALLEIIEIIKQSHFIPPKFIKYLKHIKKNIYCYIDFDFLNHLSQNKIKVLINEENLTNSSSSSDRSNELLNLEEKIDRMLKKDSILLNEIIDNKNFKKDEYGIIN